MMIEADGVYKPVSYHELFKANSAVAVKKEKAADTIGTVFNSMG